MLHDSSFAEDGPAWALGGVLKNSIACGLPPVRCAGGDAVVGAEELAPGASSSWPESILEVVRVWVCSSLRSVWGQHPSLSPVSADEGLAGKSFLCPSNTVLS